MKAAPAPERIFLVGLSGSGKSAVATLLAKALGSQALDADAEIERRAGKPISRIFSDDGEPAFRELERLVVLDLASRSGAVIALGGGAVLDPDVRARLLDAGLLIWLQVQPSQAARRLRPALADQPRPLLGDDPESRLAELLDARSNAYAAAPLHVPTDGLDPAAVTEKIMQALRAPRAAGMS